MTVVTWDTRGSLPLAGENYSRYGGNTTCVEVRSTNLCGQARSSEKILAEGLKMIGPEENLTLFACAVHALVTAYVFSTVNCLYPLF